MQSSYSHSKLLLCEIRFSVAELAYKLINELTRQQHEKWHMNSPELHLVELVKPFLKINLKSFQNKTFCLNLRVKLNLSLYVQSEIYR